jgi:hypothetical protein
LSRGSPLLYRIDGDWSFRPFPLWSAAVSPSTTMMSNGR